MKARLLFLILICFWGWGCAAQKKHTAKRNENALPTVFDNKYYENLEGNIVRIHKLMQGTFVAHSETKDNELEFWNVTGGDSVILYSVAIGDIAKHGYWLYSYEFMTSLPNNPIYTSIKQIQQQDRDSFSILYHKPAIEFKLIDILKNEDVIKNIDVKSLVPTDKKVVYVKNTASNFLGSSLIYEDKDCRCLRQNTYDISPLYYNVETIFYNKKDQQKLDKRGRPNLMVRRDISKEVLLQIAEKEYILEKDNR